MVDQRRLIRLTAVLFFVVMLGACSKDGGQTAQQNSDLNAELKNSNVVIVLVDTLRADHLPWDGYQRDTAPFLNSIAKRGVIFDHAYAGCSSTAPSVASVFTSRYPAQHGVITGFLATKKLLKTDGTIALNKIPEDMTTLVEHFHQAGYRTFGVADNLNISDHMGFTQGFDRFHVERAGGAERVNSQLREWKAEIQNGGKYLVYLHYLDPHGPYEEQQPWFNDWQPSGKDKKEKVLAAYDSEIRYTDSKIQELFEDFGWGEDTLVIFLSDHGEEFWDHGKVGHGKSLYREVIRVPFFIAHRAFKPHRIEEIVHTIDLLPTLAEILDFRQDPEWVGVSLASAMSGSSVGERTVFSQLLRRPEHPFSEKQAAVDNGFQMIQTRNKDGRERKELYKQTDLQQKEDLATSTPGEATRLAAKLTSIRPLEGSSEQQVIVEVDNKMLEELRTLGYAR